MNKNKLAQWGCVGLLLGCVSVNAAAPQDGSTGIRYYADLHESGVYKGAEIYRKDYPREYWWADSYLNSLTAKRYKALDYPLQDALTNALVTSMQQEGMRITSQHVSTSGSLTASFVPIGVSNTLKFNISGISASAYAHVKKSWYAEGNVWMDISNISVSGQYNYFTGAVDITNVSVPFKLKVDMDLNIPILGDIIDPLLDNYVDSKMEGSVPADLGVMFTGGSYSLFAVKDFIPLNKLVYQGVDYGMVLRDKLSKETLINDNFSVTIGNIVAQHQLFSVTIGNATYKRWTTGGKQVCQLGTPNCEPI